MGKWCFLPYDFDTAIGINNEGTLAFSYELEDIDQVAGTDVFNGQHSVLWTNLRQAYFDEIKAMYQDLRSKGLLSYADTERRFEEHQSKWPEAVFNEDAYFKYLAPLIEDNSAAYLSMLQGSKAEQRKWWLYNRYRYLDSKYNAGDALSDVITVRGYAKADITVTPYADIYASVKYGSYLVQQRALRGASYTLECPLDNVNDTEIYIYSASQLKDVGDLSGLMVGYAEFSLATKLQSLKLGDVAESYSNTNLTDLHLGNNVLLRTLDVRNCPNLTQAVDVSGCSNLEHVYFDGTSITGLLLPVGGILKTLHLPATITNLTIRNQASLQDLSIPSYAGITTLRLENVSSAVDSKAILDAIPANSRVRLIGIDWAAGTADKLMEIIGLLDSMRGLDEAGNNTDMAQVSGTISVDTVTGAQLAEIAGKYPDIHVAYQHVTSYLYFYNEDGSTLLYTQAIVDGGDGTYSGSTPTKASTAQYNYSFSGWSRKPGGLADSTALKAVTADRQVYASFTASVRKYTVYFYNGSTRLQTVNNVPYGGSATYTGTAPVKTGVDDPELYKFTGWKPTGQNITGNTTCYAQYNYLGIPTLFNIWYPDSESAMTAKTTLYGSTTGYNGSGTYADRSSITELNIVDIYTPSGEEDAYWDASYYKNGSVMAYRTGTTITICGDGHREIKAYKSCEKMFHNMGKLTTIIGFDLLNTEEVTNMSFMFANCSKLSTIDMSNFKTSNVTKMEYMFEFCYVLPETFWDVVASFDVSKVNNMHGVFWGCRFKSIDLSRWDTSNVTDMSAMFKYAYIETADFNCININKVTDMTEMFYQCTSLTTLDIGEWSLDGVDATGMFSACSELLTVRICTSDVSKPIRTTNMFSRCGKLKSIDLSGIDASEITALDNMFSNCVSLVSIIGMNNFNPIKVTSLAGIFNNCASLEKLDLSHWNLNKVTNISKMFYYCKITSLTLNNWDISNVKRYEETFRNCKINDTLITIDKITEWNWNTGTLTEEQIATMF